MPLIQVSLPQAPGLPAPAPEAALAQLARAALGLVQAAGQPVPAVVVGALAGGLTQLQIGEMVLAVRLSAPLTPGTAVKLSIATDGKGQPALQVTPIASGAAATAAQPATPAPMAQPSAAQAVVAASPAVAPQMAKPSPLAAVISVAAPKIGVPAPVVAGAYNGAPVAAAPATAVAPARPPATALDVQELAQSSFGAQTRTSGTVAGAATPTVVVVPSPGSSLAMPTPIPSTGAVTAVPTAGVSVPAAAAADAASLPTVPSAGVPRALVVASDAPPAPAAPLTPGVQALPGSALPSAPAPMAQPQVALPGVSQAPPVSAATGGPAMSPTPTLSQAPTSVQPGPAPVAATPVQAAPGASPQAGSAMAIPYRAAAPGPQQEPAPALPLAQTLADPAQAAARQNSIVPLLARLAALGPQLNALPAPAAQAALRLLAMRLEVGGLDGKALQGAVATAGVLARPGAASSPAAPNLKSALLQLRGGLAGVPGAEIEAVTAITGRPHPPLKGDEARAVRADLPLSMEGEEPARGLLGQTDAALSRLKLLQHASQPPETRPGAAAQQELRVEVPLLIGAQTALLQLVVDRDARKREKPGERGWRMRFAFASQQTGEVGAEVALFGPSVSVALWADTPAMEAALADELDGLRAALAAQGLDAGSVRVRRRAPAPSQQPGALMDSAR